jgi:SAM-dependent methyltransferase
MKATSFYTGERGERYHALRTKLRSDEVQRERAEFFADVADGGAVILDFGCGNGALLAHVRAAKRIGVEVNPYAAEDARARLDQIVDGIAAIPDQSVDTVISFHALEHVEDPAAALRGMHRILKSGGRLRIMVPCEMPHLRREHRLWSDGDPDMHLYTWSPLTLGNLVSMCGFDVENARLLPDSAGGRIGRLFPASSAIRKWLAGLGALKRGRYHVVVNAHKSAIV